MLARLVFTGRKTKRKSLVKRFLSHGAFLNEQPPIFHPKRVLVLTKFSRYEFEKQRHSNFSEDELKDWLAKRGSDYKTLIHHHDIHKRNLFQVMDTLCKQNLETKLVTRFEYTSELVEWADAIFTAGGDGTFLLAATKVKDLTKPVIGVNTDPTRSEGYLCISKRLSTDFRAALDRLLAGKFKWTWRNRIRVTLIGTQAYDDPIELLNQQLLHHEYRFHEWLSEHYGDKTKISNELGQLERVLPVLALNEVFIGESLSSRVSYYELTVDNQPKVKQKSSGLTVCTGTGSTSWNFNINKLTHQCAKEFLKIVNDETNSNISYKDNELVSKITERFNSSLMFDPGDLRIAYTIKDPVVNSTFFAKNPRGFASRIDVKSRCFDACLVIDGGLSYSFNDGTRAILEVNARDALRTVTINE